MKAVVCFVFTLALAVTYATKGSIDKFLGTMTLSDDFLGLAFPAIDIKKNGKINMEDMNVHYYYAEAAFAKNKIFKIIDTNGDKEISEDELKAYMKKPVVTHAVWECSYIKSLSLKKFCIADQLTAYVYLVLDKVAIENFFKSIESQDDQDEEITIDEVKQMKSLNPKFTDTECNNFIVEIGGDDGKITKAEFEAYVIQEDLGNDFRACRTKVNPEGCAQYENDCLKMELIDWTMNHFTEKDGLALFDLLESDTDDDIEITKEDILEVSNGDEDLASKFVILMDKSGDGKVNYAEFRTYVRSPLVRLHLERDCARKIEDQNKEVECYKEQLINRVKEFHTPVWLRTPDLDLIFTFEHLDASNDGKISVNVDLVDQLKWEGEVAKKLVKEMDGHDPDTDVSLDEFMEYAYLPHMVYGITDCMNNGKQQSRIDCYAKEIKDVVAVMFVKEKVDQFFQHYDKDNNGLITEKEVKGAGVTGKDVDNFLNELGMGNKEITYDEFSWYVRQQEFSHMVIAMKCAVVQDYHTQLLAFTTEKFTQYDGQELFKLLDVNKDWELTYEDFKADQDQVKDLINRMDLTGDNKVNFLEYWLFLFSGAPLHKTHFEEKCTKPKTTQEEEMACYVVEIINVGK